MLIFAQTDSEGLDEIVPDGLDWADGLRAVILFGAALALAILVNRGLRAILRRSTSAGVARFVGRFAGAVVAGIGFVYTLETLDVRLGPLLGILGIGGIALAFALQDVIENLISGVMLQVRRNFEVGDQIVTNEFAGTVEDVNFRSTWLRTFDGRRVILPNSMVYKNPVENRTAFDKRRTTLSVGVDYGADLAEAQETLVDAASSAPGVLSEPAVEAWVETFGASSIDFAVRFWHAPEIATEWEVRDAVAQQLKQALDRAGIGIPFPQRVLHWVGDDA